VVSAVQRMARARPVILHMPAHVIRLPTSPPLPPLLRHVQTATLPRAMLQERFHEEAGEGRRAGEQAAGSIVAKAGKTYEQAEKA